MLRQAELSVIRVRLHQFFKAFFANGCVPDIVQLTVKTLFFQILLD